MSKQSGRVNTLKLAVQTIALVGVQHRDVIDPALNGGNGFLVGPESPTDLRPDSLDFATDAIVLFRAHPVNG